MHLRFVTLLLALVVSGTGAAGAADEPVERPSTVKGERDDVPSPLSSSGDQSIFWQSSNADLNRNYQGVNSLLFRTGWFF